MQTISLRQWNISTKAYTKYMPVSDCADLAINSAKTGLFTLVLGSDHEPAKGRLQCRDVLQI